MIDKQAPNSIRTTSGSCPLTIFDQAPLTIFDRASHQQKERERVFTTLKNDVNAFLYVHLPGAMTLKEMETVSCAVLSLIEKAWTEKGYPDA